MKASRIKPRSYYISRCVDVHGDRYDYSKLNYTSSREKVVIICKVHGAFKQNLMNHIQGKGCHDCAGYFRYNSDTIKIGFIAAHGDKYDYSRVVYDGDAKKVCIICDQHGEFWQTPTTHKNGSGCRECARLIINKKRKVPKSKSIKDFHAVHGNKYSYSKSIFKNMADKIEIVCEKHGSFWQAPITHKQGIGCPDCANEKRHGFSLTKYTEISESKYKGISFLYLIKCSNKKEVFYKIGISVRGAKGRYCSKATMPYDYKVIHNIPLPVKDAWQLEREICSMLKPHQYRPDIYFGGSIKECFSYLSDEALNAFDRLA